MMIGYKGKKMDFSMFVTFQVSDDSVLSLKDGLQVPKYNIDNFDVTTNGKRKSIFEGLKQRWQLFLDRGPNWKQIWSTRASLCTN